MNEGMTNETTIVEEFLIKLRCSLKSDENKVFL